MNLIEFTKITFESEKEYFTRNQIVCNDGFKMSVQGSSGHYCSPRLTDDNYTSMEIGFPSEVESLILEFAENKEDPTQTVYGWVDCDIIQKVIDKHGGIDVEETMKPKH